MINCICITQDLYAFIFPLNTRWWFHIVVLAHRTVKFNHPHQDSEFALVHVLLPVRQHRPFHGGGDGYEPSINCDVLIIDVCARSGSKIDSATMSSYENGPKRTVDSTEDLEAMTASGEGAAGHIRSIHHLHSCRLRRKVVGGCWWKEKEGGGSRKWRSEWNWRCYDELRWMGLTRWGGFEQVAGWGDGLWRI